MHARARDRGDVDDRAPGGLELVHQSTRQHDRREEIHPEHVIPDLDRRVDRGEPLAALRLGRDRRIVDERVQLAMIEPLLDLTYGFERVCRISEIDLDVVLRTRLPWAVLRKRVTRTGDHAPAGGRETLDCRVPDPAACSGQEQCSARLIVVWRDHAATLDHNWWL